MTCRICFLLLWAAAAGASAADPTAAKKVPPPPVAADDGAGAKPSAPPPAADTEPAVETKHPPMDPDTIRLHLMDGSVITGKLSVSNIEVETQFGALTVPVAEVRSFTPGLGSHPELGKKVYDLIDALGSSDFDERELSQKELVKLGASVRLELQRRADDPDTERRSRIKTILEELDDQASDAEEEAEVVPTESWIERDTVETSQFTAVGKIATRSFTVASLYGPLTVRLADIRRGERDVSKKSELRKSLFVDGNNLIQRGMKVTNLHVERGDKVTVTADGTMMMTPWGRALSTPEGGQNFGWFVPNSIPGGALVASIGSDENVFKVGSKSTFKAQRSGALRFGIAMPADYAQQNFPGKYNIRVRIEHD